MPNIDHMLYTEDAVTTPPRATGCRDYGEGAWYRWAVFDNDDIADLLAHLGSADLPECLMHWYREYNGPGCYFADKATARRGRFHTLVMQRCGYDI